MEKKIILFLTIYLILINPLFGKSIEIKVKVLNEVITNYDIKEEEKYLIFLNPKLKQLQESKRINIAKDSLITEIIKKQELEKFFNLDEQNKLIDIVEKQLIKRKNIYNREELLKILSNKKINYEKVRAKLKIETLWNQFIYNKYLKNVKVNEVALRKNILDQFNNKDKKFEYNLSEIIFTESITENQETKIKKINQSINQIGFENTANIFSLSSTAANGGLIGWINELQISEIINNNIKNLKINEISKPIKIESGFLLIRLNNKREIKEEINLEEQLEKLIIQEKNRQLNNFSIIFYKKLKKNIDINEF